MLYYLFDFLDKQFDLVGAGLFQFISFRAGMAVVISLLITVAFGKKFIGMLQKFQMGESIRDLGLEGQMEKKGTPTMGGLIIISAILIPVLLVSKLDNIYVILLLVTTVWMGLIGFLDDYLKVKKNNKEGLSGKLKVVGQIGIGLIVGITMVVHDDIVVREFAQTEVTVDQTEKYKQYEDIQSSITTIPFVKDNEFDYKWLLPSFLEDYTNILYVIAVIFIVTAVSNGADTGSLAIGGIIAVLALVIRKELMIPFLCGVFLIENISVILQVAYFKHTKKKYGEGRRIFKMAPLHHHYQKMGLHETKIVTRFWILGILLAIFTLATLKVR